MERKIGEIFEHNGEWYQCIPDITDDNCNNCFFQKGCSDIEGDCSSTARSDGKSVAFKKLEKVGEPYEYFIQGMGIIIVQEYILANANYIWEYNQDVVVMDCQNGKVAIEIKQNKEDMEEKKLNLKPFDLKAAKAGKPVCTRDGRKARIICFDAKFSETGNIVTLVEKENGEEVTLYHYDDGHCSIGRGYDLMMLPEKKEGWVNVYALNTCYSSKEEAEANIDRDYEHEYVRTVKISWEE